MSAPGAPPTKEKPKSASHSRSRSSGSSSRGSSTERDSSRNRSKSPIFHQLKTTEDQKTLDWLKEKNKLFRKQKSADRKKKKEERKQKQKEIEEKEARKPTIDKAVNEWMQKKKKEARLLKKRARMQRVGSDTNLKFTGSVTITETTDLKEGEAGENGAETTGTTTEVEVCKMHE